MAKTFDFECPKENCEFASTGWPSKRIRDLRAQQHTDEHETGEPMQELGEFRADNGVEV